MYSKRIFILFLFVLISQNTQIQANNIDKFTIDGSTLIYDTENIDDIENNEVNNEDTDIFFQLLSENPLGSDENCETHHCFISWL